MEQSLGTLAWRVNRSSVPIRLGWKGNCSIPLRGPLLSMVASYPKHPGDLIQTRCVCHKHVGTNCGLLCPDYSTLGLAADLSSWALTPLNWISRATQQTQHNVVPTKAQVCQHAAVCSQQDLLSIGQLVSQKHSRDMPSLSVTEPPCSLHQLS